MKTIDAGGLHLGLAFALFAAVIAGISRAETPTLQRVIALGGSVTEIVVALDRAALLVARDSTSTYPASVLALPDVGYERALSPEGVLSVAPDLIIAEGGAGPVETIEVLQSPGVPFVSVPEGYDGAALQASAAADLDRATALAASRIDRKRVLFILSMQGGGILAVVALFSLGQGASGTFARAVLWHWVQGHPLDLRDRVVIFDIRLPRMVLGVMIGTALAVSGAVMQGLFRNPLADPGLVGVGAIAGLGAVSAIVMCGLLPPTLAAWTGSCTVPVAAFLGGWISTLILYRIATRGGQTLVATMLLAGILLGAFAGAVTGILVHTADDRQLRELTFWGLGSPAGANWIKTAPAAPIIALALIASPYHLARALNVLALGEAAASHLGLPVQEMNRAAILTVAASTGASVAASGGIGYVGIVVPHLLRLVIGPDHRYRLPASALPGAILLLLADMIARSVMPPAELPIGIITALLGAPVFLWIVLQRRGLLEL